MDITTQVIQARDDVATWSADRVRAHINALEAQLAGAIAAQEEIRRRHEWDIAKIGEHLIREANEREWCNTYDAFVDDVNAYLYIELPARRKMHKITITYLVTVEHPFEATPGDEANEQCRKLEESFRGLEYHLNEPVGWDVTIECTSTYYDLED